MLHSIYYSSIPLLPIPKNYQKGCSLNAVDEEKQLGLGLISLHGKFGFLVEAHGLIFGGAYYRREFQICIEFFFGRALFLHLTVSCVHKRALRSLHAKDEHYNLRSDQILEILCNFT